MEGLPSPRPDIKVHEYRRLRDLVSQHFGIQLSEEKKVLVMNRMGNYLGMQGIRSYTEFLDRLDSDRQGELLDALASLLSTNHTYFFRDDAQFALLRDRVWPELEKEANRNGTRDLRIWCAASSTGEEAYSIVFSMLDYFGARYLSYKAGLLATDISTTALVQAVRGIYNEDRAAAVPESMRVRFMRKCADGGLEVLPEIRREVRFRKFNLMKPVFHFKKPFHVIFCRNVMIYFDAASRAALVKRLSDCLTPGGLLFVGAAEALHGEPLLEYVSPSIYRRRSRRDPP